MPLVSIIVPVYNVEKYLVTCIDSIRKQTLEDIEIIIVDDASPDNCGTIADQMSIRDNRSIVVHRRKNGGLGPARNSGLEVARGEYIGFVDSDDWIDPEMFASLYKRAKEFDLDVVFSGMRTIANGQVATETMHPFAGSLLRGEEDILRYRLIYYGALPARIKGEDAPSSVCNGLYRRSLLEENKLRFRAIRGEDKFFNTDVLRRAQSVGFVPGVYYNYRKDHQPSITNSFSEATVASFQQFMSSLIDLAAEEVRPDVRKESLLRACRGVIDHARVAIRLIYDSDASSAEKIGLVQEVCNLKEVKDCTRNYPFRKLPLKQGIFGIMLKHRMARALLLVVSLNVG